MKNQKTPVLILFMFTFFCGYGQLPYEAKTTEVGVDGTVLGLEPNWLADMGTGVSVVDFNGDGFEDIVIATGVDEPSLWWTNEGDGTFNQIDPPIENDRFQKMPLFGDIDNDGDLDLFMIGYMDYTKLYRNDGNMVFKDITHSAGIKADNEPSNGSSFGDINNDGFLDIYICNREDKGVGNFLYLNNGDMTFTECAIERGVSDGSQLSHQSIFFDYDNDGDQDLFVANDRLSRNSMYENDGNGYFTDVTASSGLGWIMDAMNAAVGDLNYDGYLDLYVTNTPGGTGQGVGKSRCFQNNGDGTFSEVSENLGLDLGYYSWAGLWMDFDNDRDEDIFVVTIRETNPIVIHQNYFEEFGLQLFLNPWPDGFPESEQISFSAVYFDFNNDGKLDVIIPNADPSPIQVWENITENSNDWIRFSLEGVHSTRDGVGTWVEVHIGEDVYIRSYQMGDGYMGQNFQKVHFGLGNAKIVDQVVVKWMSGITDTYYNVPANQVMHLVEGASYDLDVQVITSPISCNGMEDGSIEVVPQNGVSPYSIIWESGETEFLLENLASGSYSATITDAEGTEGIAYRYLRDPVEINIRMQSGNSTGEGDGWANAQVTGGTGDYSYLWDSGQTTTYIDQLIEGLYTLEVTDSNGCVEEGYAGIYNEIGPCSPGLVTEVTTGSNYALLYWGDVPNLESTRIAYRVAGETHFDYHNTSDPTEGLLLDLESSTTYEYKVVSRCNDNSKSAWSDLQEFTTLSEDAGVCEDWVADEILVDDKQAMIYFTLVPDASAYRVRFRPDGSNSWSRKTTAYPSIYTGQLDPATVYEYQRSTKCPFGWTEWTDSEYFETAEDASAIESEGSDLEFRQAPAPAEVHLFPNPVSDVLTVVVLYSDVKYFIVRDVSGKEMGQYIPTGRSVEIDVSGLSAGIYFIQVIQESGQVTTQRFVKG